MTTHPEYNEKTSATEVAKAFSEEIKDKIFVVTGISKKSIGESTVNALSSHAPASLILASRTRENLEAVASDIRATHPNTNVATVAVDLLSQNSVRQAAEEIKKLVPRVDVLINNAAMNTSKRVVSPEGIEGQFAANHLGGFLLTNLLAEHFPTARKARIVNVASEAHRCSPIRFSDWNLMKDDTEIPMSERGPDLTGWVPAEMLKKVNGYSGSRAYAQSKTANILTSVQENVKWSEKVVAYSLDPGAILTNGNRDFGGEDVVKEAIAMHNAFLKNLDQGAATTLVAALDPALNQYSGNPYLSNCQFGQAADWATDIQAVEKLWKLSEELVGQVFP